MDKNARQKAIFSRTKEKNEKKEFIITKRKTQVSCSSRDRFIHAALALCTPQAARRQELPRFHHLIPLQPPLSPVASSPAVRARARVATRLVAPGRPRSPPPMFRGHAPLLHLLAGGGGGRRRRSPHRFAASPRRHPSEHSFYLHCFLSVNHDVSWYLVAELSGDCVLGCPPNCCLVQYLFSCV